MKKLILLLIPIMSFGQPNKNALDSTRINDLGENENWSRGIKTIRGKVQVGLAKDAKGNFILGRNPSIIGTSYDNFVLGNNITITNASSIAALCTDCDFLPSSSYSVAGGGGVPANGGDGHNIGGYSSTTFGYLNDNFIDGGTAIGTNIRLGRSTANNLYTRSVGVGSTLNIQNTDVYMFGIGNGQEQTEKGAYFIYGANKFGLLPDGRILINGIAYRFPTAQGQGVLTNDGFGNLTWGSSVTTQTTAFKIYDTQGRLLFYQPVKN